MRRLVGRNDVLDETRTAERLVESSRAHAPWSKFTSGSRPSSSRPGAYSCCCGVQNGRYETNNALARFTSNLL